MDHRYLGHVSFLGGRTPAHVVCRRAPGILAVALATLPAALGQTFVERAGLVGLDHTHRGGFDRVGDNGALTDWQQSGIALGDLDGDGDLDVVACGGVEQNHVFRNDGAVFADVTRATGIETGEFDRVPILGDYDDDGDLDIFVGASIGGDGKQRGRSRLYRNEGAMQFVEVTPLTGRFGFGHTLHAQWADLDLDGLLDLYLGEFFGTANAYYRNNGDGTFSEMGQAVGLANFGAAHVVSVLDSDRDGFPNVFVGNDFQVSVATVTQNAPDAVLSGMPNGTFVDSSTGSNCNHPITTMGMSWGDVNYDGLLDLYKTEFGTNFLLLNNAWPQSALAWTRAEFSYGVDDTLVYGSNGLPVGRSIGWGTAFRHLDLDPWIDLVLINGRVGAQPEGQKNRLWRGRSPLSGTLMTDKTQAWGFVEQIDDRGLSTGDVDGDGDVDLLVAPISGPLRYYENQLDRAGNGSLRVIVETTTSAPGGAGSVVSWTDVQGFPHVLPILADAPTAGQCAPEVVFGLGKAETVDVDVEFPSGLTRTYTGVPRDTLLVAQEPELIALDSRVLSTADAGATFRVRAFAHDANGVPLGAGANVTLEAPGLVAAGPVQHVSGNEFRRDFVIPHAPGEFRIAATFDAFQVLVRPRVVVRGVWSPSATTATTYPASARANSGDEVEVIVVPRDAAGRALGAGLALSLEVRPPSGNVAIPLTDGGDGRYHGVWPVTCEAGRHPLSLSLGGSAFGPIGRLEVAGVVDPARTSATVYAEKTSTTSPSEDRHRIRFLLTPVDAAGRRSGPAADVELRVFPDPGTEDVSVLRGSNRDGEWFFDLAHDPTTGGNSARGLLEFYVDRVLVERRSYVF